MTVLPLGYGKVIPQQVLVQGKTSKPLTSTLCWPELRSEVITWSLAKAGLAQGSFPLLPVSPQEAWEEFQCPGRQGQIKLLYCCFWLSPQPRPAAGEGTGLSLVLRMSEKHPFSPLFTLGAPLLPHSWPPFITDSISLWHILGSRMLRSQGEAFYQSSGDKSQEP